MKLSVTFESSTACVCVLYSKHLFSCRLIRLYTNHHHGMFTGNKLWNLHIRRAQALTGSRSAIIYNMARVLHHREHKASLKCFKSWYRFHLYSLATSSAHTLESLASFQWRHKRTHKSRPTFLSASNCAWSFSL